jgi:very-short-patch-repair endonuclease
MPNRTAFADPRLVAARELAQRQGGVLSRPQLYALRITRYEIRGEVRAHRWQLMGDQSVCLHNTVERHRVSVPRGARVRRTRLYDIRQTRRWSADDLAASGIRRTRPDVAGVRAALWATSDKQAVYLLTLVVQRGLTTAELLGAQALRIRRDRRRQLVQTTILDLLEGARSLGELDVVRELRRRGLPLPTRQVLRRDKASRYYLDLYWDEYGLVVEVDGIHHAWATNVVGDALRQNSLVIASDRVLRLPLLGLRLEPDAFFDQIEEALVAGGWRAHDVIRMA